MQVPESVLGLDLIVGGMGIDISSVELVAEVARHPSGRCSGNLSVTALSEVYARLLQTGDPGGEIRAAFDAFNQVVPSLAPEVDALYRRYHIPGGKDPSAPFTGPALGGSTPSREVQLLFVTSAFAHVWRVKRAAPGRPVGINFLRKVERPLLYGLYGVMLAGVDWVVMGAGDPGEVPGWMDLLARHEPAELPLHVATVPHGAYKIRFAPRELTRAQLPPLRRPPFFAIISSHLQAAALHSDPKTRPDGFVVEGSDAGGHNAPPREKRRDERGDYVYGPEDVADLDAVAAIGLPFWIAGGWGHPEKLKSAQGRWRPHLQVGTLFALAAESAMEPTVRRRVLDLVWHRDLEVVSHATASPSTYPFKVALVPGTLGDPAVYEARERICNIGHLRGWRPNGSNPVGLCPADAENCFIRAGGAPWRTRGSMCLCNSLLATRGLGQPGEPAVVTLGDITSVRSLQSKLKRMDYSAREAVDFLLDG